MKKGFVLQSLLCLFAVSCSISEIDMRDASASSDEIFYASLEPYSDAGTKVYVDENVKTLWDEDDRVSIFNRTTFNQEYRFAGATGDNAGAFKKVPGGGSATGNDMDFIVSAYPYQESTKIDDNGVMTLTLPAEQTYREGSFGPGANTMVSATEDNYLKFKNVCGYLVLKFYGEGVSVSSVKLEGHNGEPLSGEATLTPAVGSTPTVSMSSTAGTSVKLQCETPVELGATKEDATLFWLVVPPTDFTGGFKLTVTDENGGVFVKETSKNMSISRNGVLRISPIEVTPTVPVKYTKVSSITVGGTYLLVDADDKRLFKGETDGSFGNVSPEDDVITDVGGTLTGYEFTVESDGSKFYLKSNDGKYLVCDYTNNSSAGLAYVNAPSDVRYPYALTTGNNGAFFFSTTQVNSPSNTNQVLYFKAADNIFKIGGSGTNLGVHLYMKDGKQDRGLVFDPETVTCILGDIPEKPVLSGTYTEVTYSSSNDQIAMVDADGNVTPLARGVVTITATVAEDDEYSGGSASYTLKVKSASTGGRYVRVTSLDRINLEGEYVIVYEDATVQKAFKPILNSAGNAFSTSSDNAVDVVVIDDEIDAAEVDDCRFSLANQDGTNKKFSLVVPEADGTDDYYFIVYGKDPSGSMKVFFASRTETGYRSTFSLSSDGALTLTGNNSYRFRYSSGSFTAGTGTSGNLFLFVREGGQVKQKQTLSFAEPTVTWTLGDDYAIDRSYEFPQFVTGAQTTVTYSAEPESVAKIEGDRIRIVGTGSATITATAEKTEQYYAATATYTLRILNAPVEGWVDLGTVNLENRALYDYLNEAIGSYSDTDDATNSVMVTYATGSDYASIDRKDCPNPVTIAWTNSASASTVITIYQDQALTVPVWSQNATERSTSADVYNLIPGRAYYYTVSEGTTVWEKGYFNTTGRRRMIKVSDIERKGHANNCRDLGGLEVTDKGEKKTIKYGYLFRGTNMDKTTDTEKDLLTGFLNVGMDIDLRSGSSLNAGSSEDGNSNCYQPFTSPYAVGYVNPGFNSFGDLTTVSKIRSVVTAIIETAKTGKASYFHCYIGADRTGYVAMLMEGLLGVSEKDCSIDYELTSFSEAAELRYRTGQPKDYYFRQGISFLRGQAGDTFQDKVENYLVNTVGISQADIDEFKGIVLQ